jgi:hypothetical protein
MREDLDLTNFKFVKAYYPLAVVAHYLTTHADVPAVDRSALVRWLILALVSGRYAERGQSKYGVDIRNTTEKAALRQLFQSGREPLNPDLATGELLDNRALLGSGFRSAYVTLLYMVARKLGATDWLSQGILVGADLDSGATWQFHHIFPDSSFNEERRILREAHDEAKSDSDEDEAERCRRALDDLDARVASIANLGFLVPTTSQTLLTREPSEYLKEIAGTAQGKAALEAQLIPMNPKLWEHAAFEDFRRERCRLLASKAKELFFPAS